MQYVRQRKDKAEELELKYDRDPLQKVSESAGDGKRFHIVVGES